MQRALFFVACVAIFHVSLSSDDHDEPPKPPYAQEPPTITKETECDCGEYPPICSNKNEVYDDCKSNNCRPKLCSELGYQLDCNKKCKPGCTCKEDYVQNDKGICIPVKDCPSCGGDKHAQSGCGNNCGKTCATINKPKPVVCTLMCKLNSCDCRDGYVYDANLKKCVKKEDCTKPCKENEVYSTCVNGGCDRRNCSELNEPIKCIHPIKCKGGCVCKKDWLRAKNGTCVPEKKCPPESCKENEVYSTCVNGGCDRRNCSELNEPIKCIDPIKCKEGCVCKKDWLRAKNGTCVPVKQCPQYPPKCSNKNEVYDDCKSNNCRPKLCSDLGYQLDCNKKCKPGCTCKEGYVQNDKGICIPVKDCPSCGGDKHAQSGCGNNCGKTCATINKSKPVVCTLKCKLNSCDCRDGYVYDPNPKKCVKKENCTKPCKENEVYSTCVNGGCDRRNCSELNEPIKCIHPIKCKGGCVCKKDWLRAKNGTCVPEKKCPPESCKENEVYSTCVNGGCDRRNCSELNEPIKCIDPIKCKEGCVCKKDWLRAKNGTCVPEKQCPQYPPKCSNKNEVYDDCKSNNCRPKLCSELGYQLDCNKKCKPGCTCKEGYVQNDKGICIPVKDCPSCGGDKHAQSGCGNNCGKTCATINKPKPVVCTLKCKLNSCDCRDGYVYDPNPKKCVKKEDCTKPCKENEVYSTCVNGGCDRRNCSELNEPIKCIDPIKCKEGCVCKKDWLRAKNGTCVPEKQCPPVCKGQNEYYEPCIHNCGSQNCSDIGKVYHCPNQKPGQCDSSGCRCKPGYLRNSTNCCVAQKDCPPLDCPPGQKWEPCPTVPCEGDYCPKTRTSPQTCPVGIVCDPPRCVCGYNRKKDWKTKQCIKITDCPPFQCGYNEEYVACPSDCPGEKCSDYLNKTKCPPYRIGIIANCRPACKCKKGYYKNAKNECVLACDC